MQDKTGIVISDLLREFIGALVEEVIVEEKQFDSNKKKNLKKYITSENANYEDIEKNLTLLFSISMELKKTESKVLEKHIEIVAENCYLSGDVIHTLIRHIGKMRNTNPNRRNSDYEDVHARWLNTQQDKEKAIKVATEAERKRIDAEEKYACKKRKVERLPTIEEEQRKTKRAIGYTCLAVVAFFVVMLIVNYALKYKLLLWQ